MERLWIAMFIIICICTQSSRGEDGITTEILSEHKAVIIAKKTATDLGYKVGTLAMETSYNTNKYNYCIPAELSSEYPEDLVNKLESKEYWTVYLYEKSSPGTSVKGGDICIYVDSRTGDVLGTFRGE